MEARSCAQTKDLFEEWLNCLTHAVGAILAGIGTFFLVKQSLIFNDDLIVIAVLLYGITTTLALCASAVYHGLRCKLLKHKFRILDHITIYLMIAGGYSPVLLIPLRDTFGITLFAITWFVAFLGILWKIFYFDMSEAISVASYMILGWMGLFLLNPIIEIIPNNGLLLIFIGGLIYTVGVFFYINDHRKYFHTIWHLLVLIASGFHYFAISEYIIKVGG